MTLPGIRRAFWVAVGLTMLTVAEWLMAGSDALTRHARACIKRAHHDERTLHTTQGNSRSKNG